MTRIGDPHELLADDGELFRQPAAPQYARVRAASRGNLSPCVAFAPDTRSWRNVGLDHTT